MRTMLVIGAGPTGIPAIDDAAERNRWNLARHTFTGFEPRGALAQALAREDGWAVLLPFSWTLVDAIDFSDAPLILWEYSLEERVESALGASR